MLLVTIPPPTVEEQPLKGGPSMRIPAPGDPDYVHPDEGGDGDEESEPEEDTTEDSDEKG